jgi:hypothetical protein
MVPNMFWLMVIVCGSPLPAPSTGYMDLFAGAAGAFKNASSHRTVSYREIREVQQVLMFVSLLLHIIDTRAGGTSSP